MIVELFGPPCAGKTTFARLLATAIRARGFDAQPVVSARASESKGAIANEGDKAPPGNIAAEQSRLRQACQATNRALLRLLPPRSPLWQFRLRRYLHALANSWARSDAAPGVLVFDQGYVQALCSLVSLTQQPDPASIRAAVEILPEPALRIQLRVPQDVLLTRLAQRAENLTLRERMLELDNAKILQQDRICATLSTMLEGRGDLTSAVSSHATDMSPFADAVASKLRAQAMSSSGLDQRILREFVRS